MRNLKIELPEWFDVFSLVCARGKEALQWDLPEAWVHAELYAELKRRAGSTGWVPFPTEVPYVTLYPVQLPKKTNRDWKTAGAVKWVDLCLRSEAHNAWCWFEFKVRHVRQDKWHRNASLQAQDAFRKDVVALMGLDTDRTANTWEAPDIYTKAYWFEKLLKPCAASLPSGRHHLVAAFLQLDSQFDPAIWEEKNLIEQIRKWFSYRDKQAGHQRTYPGISVAKLVQPIAGNCSLLVCTWSLGSEDMSNDP